MIKVKSIRKASPLHPFESYTHILSPLQKKEGGGFLITFPDLPGCISDGDSIDEAIENGRDAFSSWISACVDAGEPIPAPQFQPEPTEKMSGKFVARVPKSIHATLAARAKSEGVSLNTIVVTLLAQGLGHHPAH